MCGKWETTWFDHAVADWMSFSCRLTCSPTRTGTASHRKQSIIAFCLTCGWSHFIDISGFDTERKKGITVTQIHKESLCLISNEHLLNGEQNPEGEDGR